MKHCILVKYTEEVNDAKKQELIPEITAVFQPLLNMEGIHGIDIIPNVVDRPNRYDLLIRIDMDQEVLTEYDHSEPHKVWKSEYAHYLDKKAIFDYE